MYLKHYLSIICVSCAYVNCFDVPIAFNPKIDESDIYVICHNSKQINVPGKTCLDLEAANQSDKILQTAKERIRFLNYYFNDNICCYYVYQTDIKNNNKNNQFSKQCDISFWFFLYTGIVAFIVLIVQAICIYNIRKKKQVLQDQKRLLQGSIKKKDDVETSHKFNNKYRHLEHTQEKQIPVRSNLPYQYNMKHDRENSNIYHSVDNLHIATRDPSPPPFNRMKAEKQYHWRISKREMDVLPKIPPREPIDRKPYIPKPEQALPPVTAHQSIPVPLITEKPRTEKRLITTELTSVLNKRKMAENAVPNQNHIPSNPEIINVPNVLPMVKTTMSSITSIQPQMPKTNPAMQKLATVTHSFRRTPKERVPTPPPSSHDSTENTSFYYSNETEDWNYEELKSYPIYTNK